MRCEAHCPRPSSPLAAAVVTVAGVVVSGWVAAWAGDAVAAVVAAEAAAAVVMVTVLVRELRRGRPVRGPASRARVALPPPRAAIEAPRARVVPGTVISEQAPAGESRPL